MNSNGSKEEENVLSPLFFSVIINANTNSLFSTMEIEKMPYILIIFQENMKVSVFTENRVRRKPLKKDFMRGHSLLEDSEILTEKTQVQRFQFALLNSCPIQFTSLFNSTLLLMVTRKNNATRLDLNTITW